MKWEWHFKDEEIEDCQSQTMSRGTELEVIACVPEAAIVGKGEKALTLR